MELNGTIQPKGSLYGSFDFDQADYNLLKNKPSINGVELVGNKTSQDLHITGGGGGGGTTNYNDLENKPKINDIILQDELSLHSLGIQSEIEFPEDPTKYLDGEGNFTTPPGYNPPDYSTNEVNTGLKWIDGKDVYCKCYETTVSDENNKQIDTMVNDNINVLPMSGASVKTTGQYNTQFGSSVVANAPVRIIVSNQGVFTNLENYNSIYGTTTIRIILYYTRNN